MRQKINFAMMAIVVAGLTQAVAWADMKLGAANEGAGKAALELRRVT